nr:MAG TPA: hypothetical protein [Caudoviricetes sp.]
MKDHELKQMENIENWHKPTKGLYRFVVASNVCYEIQINIHQLKTPLIKANASLFLVGDWIDKDGVSFFARECLLGKQSISACIEKAIQDYRENMN